MSSVLKAFFAVVECDVSYFMSDNTEEFVVVHDVHKRGEYAHAAVGACESVYVNHEIYLEVQGYTVGVGYSFGESAQTLGVFAVFGVNLVVAVHPVYRFLYIVGHLGVGERECFGCLDAGARRFLRLNCAERDVGATIIAIAAHIARIIRFMRKIMFL